MVNRMPFFFIISNEKINALMPLICLRKVHYQKKNGNFAQKAKFVEVVWIGQKYRKFSKKVQK